MKSEIRIFIHDAYESAGATTGFNGHTSPEVSSSHSLPRSQLHNVVAARDSRIWRLAIRFVSASRFRRKNKATYLKQYVIVGAEEEGDRVASFT